MINITVFEDNLEKRIAPVEMLDNKYNNRIFKMYEDGRPSNSYFINCGINEPSLILLWWSDEECKYELSTANSDDLKDYNSHISVGLINARVDISLKPL